MKRFVRDSLETALFLPPLSFLNALYARYLSGHNEEAVFFETFASPGLNRILDSFLVARRWQIMRFTKHADFHKTYEFKWLFINYNNFFMQTRVPDLNLLAVTSRQIFLLRSFLLFYVQFPVGI